MAQFFQAGAQPQFFQTGAQPQPNYELVQLCDCTDPTCLKRIHLLPDDVDIPQDPVECIDTDDEIDQI